MGMAVLYEDEFPDGPNGERVDVYEGVVGKYLVRAWNVDTEDEACVQLFDRPQELFGWLDEFSCEFDNVTIFYLLDLYKWNGELLQAKLT